MAPINHQTCPSSIRPSSTPVASAVARRRRNMALKTPLTFQPTKVSPLGLRGATACRSHRAVTASTITSNPKSVRVSQSLHLCSSACCALCGCSVMFAMRMCGVHVCVLIAFIHLFNDWIAGAHYCFYHVY